MNSTTNATNYAADDTLYHVVRYSVLQLLNFVIIGLNSFIIKILTNNKQFQSATFAFLANQAASDILFAIAASLWPFVCIHDFAHPTFGNTPAQLACETSVWFIWTGYALSPWFLAAVAYERFASLFFPFRAPIKPKPIAITLWCLCLVMQLLFTIDYPSITFLAPESFHGCFTSFAYLANNALIQSLIAKKLSVVMTQWIPIVLIGLFSTATVIKMLTLNSVGVSNSRSYRDQVKKMKVIKIVLLITFVYYFLTAPLTFRFLFSVFKPRRFKCPRDKPLVVDTFHQVVVLLMRLACISNPIILITFNDCIRGEFMRIVCCRKTTQITDNSAITNMSNV